MTTFTRESLVDILRDSLDPEFLAKMDKILAEKRQREQKQEHDEQEPPHTPNRSG